MWLDNYERIEGKLEEQYKEPKALNAAILSFYIKEMANYWEGNTVVSSSQLDYLIENIQERLGDISR